MNPRPIDVKPLDNYKLFITFKNGECKIFDAMPLLELPVYFRLKNKGFFSTVKADGMCVYWDDELDICPDTLYENSILAMEEFASPKNHYITNKSA
jgi:hypothetical protein